MWGDDAKFHNSDLLNRHISYYWSPVNSHWIMKTRFENTLSVNVWGGLFNGRTIGPYFYETTLTAERHLLLLEHFTRTFRRNTVA